MSQPDTTDSALANVSSIPRDEDGPVFAEPWQAEVFAMTLTLYEQGLFSWPEWAEHLAQQISLAQSEGDPDFGDTYYNHWLAALEKMVQTKEIGAADQLLNLYQQWNDAALATPHGQAIELPR